MRKLARVLSVLLVLLLILAVGGCAPPPAGDSDGDGLSNTEESQLGTDPNDDHDPGIYCLYNGLYMTKDYFCWQSLGGIDIALNSLVVRRGANAIIGGAPNAAIAITKSIPALTGLTAAGAEPTWPTWSISIGDQNTVGHYTITLTEGAWSKSIEMYVIFELPQTTTDDGVDCDENPPNVYDDDDDIYELTDAGLKAYLYDEDSQKDDISVMWFASSDAGEWTDFERDYGEPCKGDGYYWHSLFCAGRFDNKQYTKKVLVDHVMQAINGETNQWNAAVAIQNYIAPPFKDFTYPDPYFDMFGGNYSDWLDGTSIYGNPGAECSAFAAATCSFLRSAGIPARVVVVDHHAYHGETMNYDHATELWVSDPANPGAQWYVMLGRSAGAGIEARPEPTSWPDSVGNRLMVTAGPDFVIADLDKAKGVDDSMEWLTDPAEGGDSVSAGWWDYHHWYVTPSNANGADPGWMARRLWVLTENKVYWGINITDPATVDGCIWSAEPT